MNKMIILQFLLVTAVFAAGFMAGEIRAAARSKVFELRTYTTNDGKLGDLNKRFREHTISIFNRHGMKSVWYGVPQDAPLRDNTLIYMLEHESRRRQGNRGTPSARTPSGRRCRPRRKPTGRS